MFVLWLITLIYENLKSRSLSLISLELCLYAKLELPKGFQFSFVKHAESHESAGNASWPSFLVELWVISDHLIATSFVDYFDLIAMLNLVVEKRMVVLGGNFMHDSYE